jgi:hypothetical protein
VRWAWAAVCSSADLSSLVDVLLELLGAELRRYFLVGGLQHMQRAAAGRGQSAAATRQAASDPASEGERGICGCQRTDSLSHCVCAPVPVDLACIRAPLACAPKARPACRVTPARNSYRRGEVALLRVDAGAAATTDHGGTERREGGREQSHRGSCRIRYRGVAARRISSRAVSRRVSHEKKPNGK